MGVQEHKPKPNHQCPLCGGDNRCAPAWAGHFEVECWCRNATIDPQALARIPEASRSQHCLCPACASGHHAEKVNEAG